MQQEEESQLKLMSRRRSDFFQLYFVCRVGPCQPAALVHVLYLQLRQVGVFKWECCESVSQVSYSRSEVKNYCKKRAYL